MTAFSQIENRLQDVSIADLRPSRQCRALDSPFRKRISSIMSFVHQVYILYGYRTDLSEWLSILSVFLSTYVALQVRKVKLSVSNKVQLPKMIEDLKGSAGKISALMADFQTNKNEIGSEVEICRARLKIISALTNGQPKATVRKILRSTKNLNADLRKASNFSAVNDIWALYQQINGVLEELKHEHDLHTMGI